MVGIGGYTAKNITESSINDLTLGEGTLANLSTIGFSNPDQGEFYIDETSPITIAGTNGRGLGDPRWLPAGNSTGIEDNFTSENAIWAYASNGVIYLKGVVSGSFIEVYTYNGTCIANQLASDNEISIYAPKGNYIIRVTHNDTVSTYKVMNF